MASDTTSRSATVGAVAVIGAGAAGLSCAYALARAGRRVFVFEKSGDIGGRLATRRRDDLHWNHGAPAADLRAGSDLKATRELLLDGGAIRRGARLLGKPDMRELLRPLTTALDVRCTTTIARMERSAKGWYLWLRTTDDNTEQRLPTEFEAVVCTTPPDQAKALLRNSDISTPAHLGNVCVAPCWALLVTLQDHRAARIVDCAEIEGLRSLHPGNLLAEQSRTWVAHADAHWSERSLEWQPAAVVAALQAPIAAALGQCSMVSAKAHRWRYALTSTPLAEPCLPLCGQRLVLAGDWCLGANVDAAVRSGAAAAQAILKASY